MVRLVDVLLVRRDEDGSFDTLPPPPGADPDLGRVAAAVLGVDDGDAGGADGAEQEGWSLADAVPPAGWPRWRCWSTCGQQPLVTAIDAAGGRLLGELWLSPEDRARIPG